MSSSPVFNQACKGIDESPVIAYVQAEFAGVIQALNALQDAGRAEADIDSVLRQMGVSYGGDPYRGTRIDMILNLLARHDLLQHRYYFGRVLFSPRGRMQPERALSACVSPSAPNPVALLNRAVERIHHQRVRKSLNCRFCAYFDGRGYCVYHKRSESTNSGVGACETYEDALGHCSVPPAKRANLKNVASDLTAEDAKALAPVVDSAVASIVNETFECGQMHVDARWICRKIGSPGDDQRIKRLITRSLEKLHANQFLEETVAKIPKHYRIVTRAK